MKLLLLASIAICPVFTFINGFHDGCNIIATIIASRSMKPKSALRIACVASFSGAMLLGTNVAATIGKDVLKFDILKGDNGIKPAVLFLSAILGGIIWNLITWWIGMPSSSSHALVGGIVGAGLTAYGINSIQWHVFFNKVLIALFTTPVIGFVIGYIFLKLVVAVTKDMHPRVNNFLKRIQIVSMFLLGASQGSNDSQKSMGIIAAVMFLSGMLGGFVVPWWVQVICALAFALGLSAGGWRLIKTVGVGIFSVRPIHSFSSQMASALTVITASITGSPVSTTQIVNSSIMGVGAAERKNAVRWDTVRSILISWIFTIPASASVAAVLYLLFKWTVM